MPDPGGGYWGPTGAQAEQAATNYYVENSPAFEYQDTTTDWSNVSAPQDSGYGPSDGWGFNQGGNDYQTPQWQGDIGGSANVGAGAQGSGLFQRTNKDAWQDSQKYGYGQALIAGPATAYDGGGSAMDTLNQAYRYTVSRPLATLAIATNPAQQSAYGDLRKAWNESDYISPGQAITANPHAFASGMWAPDNETLSAEKSGELNFANRDSVEKYYAQDSVLSSMGTGALDLAANFVDPTWLLGWGMKASKVAALGRVVEAADMPRFNQWLYEILSPEFTPGKENTLAAAIDGVFQGQHAPVRKVGAQPLRTVGEDVPDVILGGEKATINPTGNLQATNELLSTGKEVLGRDLSLLPSGVAVDNGLVDKTTGKLLDGVDLATVTGYRLSDQGRLVHTQLDGMGNPRIFAKEGVYDKQIGAADKRNLYPGPAFEDQRWMPTTTDKLPNGNTHVHSTLLSAEDLLNSPTLNLQSAANPDSLAQALAKSKTKQEFALTMGYAVGSDYAKQIMKDMKPDLFYRLDAVETAAKDLYEKAGISPDMFFLRDTNSLEKDLMGSGMDAASMTRVTTALKTLDSDIGGEIRQMRELYSNHYSPRIMFDQAGGGGNTAVMRGISRATDAVSGAVSKPLGMGVNSVEKRVARQIGNDPMWFEPSSKPGMVVGVIGRQMQEVPDFSVPIKGVSAEDAWASIRAVGNDVPLYTQGRRGKRNTVVKWADGTESTGYERLKHLYDVAHQVEARGESAEVGLKNAVEWLNAQIWEDHLVANGIPRDKIDAVMQIYRDNIRPGHLAAKTEVEKNGYWYDMHNLDVDGKPTLVHAPQMAFQLANYIPMSDFRQLQNIIESPAFKTSEGLDKYVGELSKWKEAKARGRDVRGRVADVGDDIMSIWKPLVLFRPIAYPLRNVGIEATARLVATLGLGGYASMVLAKHRGAKDSAELMRMQHADANELQDAFHSEAAVSSREIASSAAVPNNIRVAAADHAAAVDEIERLRALHPDTPVELPPKNPAQLHRNAAGAEWMIPVSKIPVPDDTPADLDKVLGYVDDLMSGKGFDRAIVLGVDRETGHVTVLDGVQRLHAAHALSSAGVDAGIHVPVRIVPGGKGTGFPLKRLNPDKLEQRLADRTLSDVAARPSAPRLLGLGRDTSHLVLGDAPVQSWVLDNGEGWLARTKDNQWKWVESSRVPEGEATSSRGLGVDPTSGEPVYFRTETKGTFATRDEALDAIRLERTQKFSDSLLTHGETLTPADVWPSQRWAESKTKSGAPSARDFQAKLDEGDKAIAAAEWKGIESDARFYAHRDRLLSLQRARLNRIDNELGRQLTAAGVLTRSPSYTGINPDLAQLVEEAGVPEAMRYHLENLASQMVAGAQHSQSVRSAARMAEHYEGLAGVRQHISEGAVGKHIPVTRKGGLRRGEGVQTFYDPYSQESMIFPGAFAGPQGDIMRAEVSGGRTTDSMLTSGAKAMQTSLGRKMIYHNTLIEPDNPKYWEAAADFANHGFRHSEVARMILEVEPNMASARFEDYWQFLHTAQGARERAMLGDLFGQVTRETAQKQFLQESKIINSLIPNGEARDILARGGKVDADLLKRTIEPDFERFPQETFPTYGGLAPVIGSEAQKLTGVQPRALLRTANKIASKVFEWIGTIPEDMFARMPYASHQFNQHYKEMVQRITASGGKLTLEDAEQLRRNASKLALRDVRQTLYTVERKHRGLDNIRFLSAFAEAQYNSLAFWGRTIANNPQYVARIMQMARGLDTIKDENGNWAIPIPTALRPGYLPEGMDTFAINPSSLMSLFFNSDNQVSPLGGFLPSPSPFVSWAGSEMQKNAFTGNLLSKFKGIPGVGNFLAAQVLGTYGASNEVGSWDKFMPTAGINLLHMMKANDPVNTDAQIARNEAWELAHLRWMMGGQKGPEPKATDEAIARQVAGLMTVKFFQGLVAPLGGRWENAYDAHLSNVYKRMKETDPMHADRNFVMQHPEAISLIASARAKSRMSPTWDTADNLNKHKGTYAQIAAIDPDAVSTLVPYAKGFEGAAYRWQESNHIPGSDKNIMAHLTPAEQQAEFEIRAGRMQRSMFVEKMKLYAAGHGISPDDPGYKEYRDQIRLFTDNLGKKYPAYGDKWNSPEWEGKGLRVMRTYLNDPDFNSAPENRTLIDTTRQFLAIRDYYVDQMKQVDAAGYDVGNAKHWALKDAYDATCDKLDLQDDRFSNLRNNYLYFDQLRSTSDADVVRKKSNG